MFKGFPAYLILFEMDKGFAECDSKFKIWQNRCDTLTTCDKGCIWFAKWLEFSFPKDIPVFSRVSILSPGGNVLTFLDTTPQYVLSSESVSFLHRYVRFQYLEAR